MRSHWCSLCHPGKVKYDKPEDISLRFLFCWEPQSLSDVQPNWDLAPLRRAKSGFVLLMKSGEERTRTETELGFLLLLLLLLGEGEGWEKSEPAPSCCASLSSVKNHLEPGAWTPLWHRPQGLDLPQRVHGQTRLML